MITPDQLRAARALVGWSRTDLADKSNVNPNTIKHFESDASDPKLSTLHKWKRTLEAAGVAFIEDDGQSGPGVRFRDSAKHVRKRGRP